MSQKAKWKETIDSHRAQGRGRKAFWILVFGVVLVVGSVHMFGHDRGTPQYDRHGFSTEASPEEFADRVDRLLDHLDATDAQRERIAARLDGLAPELAELAARRDALRDQIVAALAAEELTSSSIETLQQDVREQSAQLAERTIEITFEIASELTIEQRTELIERWERR